VAAPERQSLNVVDTQVCNHMLAGSPLALGVTRGGGCLHLFGHCVPSLGCVLLPFRRFSRAAQAKSIPGGRTVPGADDPDPDEGSPARWSGPARLAGWGTVSGSEAAAATW